jgi:hypothetical protein
VTVRVTVLGPQRRPTLEPVARAYGPEVRFATVTAGWQEREADDAELDGLLGSRSVNLGLHRRWHEVLDRDSELATAEVNHRAVLDELQELYAIRLDHAVKAVEAVQRSSGRPRTRAAALADAEAALRLLDEQHLRRVATAQADFDAAWRPTERAAVAAHRAEVATLLAGAGALVVAGGHVGVLLRLLTVFGVTAPPPPAVIAWSAGAMALTERVVLFGPGPAEVYAAGLGLLPGTVTRLRAPGLKVPHIGWNTVTFSRPSALTEGLGESAAFYHVHTYACRPQEESDVVARGEYGERFVSIVERGNVMGAQFHPEKSSLDGLALLRNFVGVRVAA